MTAQIEACIKKAGTKDVLKYADEGFSGELLERTALNRLREDASKGLMYERLILRNMKVGMQK